MNFFRKLLHLPPAPPTRVAKCHYCGECMKTEIMNGEVAHIMCSIAHDTIEKTKREKEAADRHQIELYKTAMREMEAERTAS